MKLREWKNKFFRWLDGDYDVMKNIMDTAQVPDMPREEWKEQRKQFREEMTYL